MADLMLALRNADAAGDADAANRIAAMIREQQTSIEEPQDTAFTTERYKNLLLRQAQGEQGLEGEISSLTEQLSAVQRPTREIPQPTPEQLTEIEGRSITDVFTGADRMTPELEAMPSIGEAPEFNEFSMESLKANIGTFTTGDPEEIKAIFKEQYGDRVSFSKDSKGNDIVNFESGPYALNKPGASPQDIPKFFGDLLAFSPAGKAKTITGAALKSAGGEAVLETVDAFLGGEFNTEEVAISALIGGGLKSAEDALGAIYRSIKGKVSPQAEQTLKEAAEAGIPVLTSDIIPPQTFAGKTAQQISEKIPLAGTGAVRESQQQFRQEAVEEIAKKYDVFSYDAIMESLKTQKDKVKKAAGSVLESTGKKLDGILKSGQAKVKKVELTKKEKIAALRAEANANRFGEDPKLEYKVNHTAPVREGANTPDDLSDIYPNDIYDTNVAGRYYGHGGPDKAMDAKSARLISEMQGQPEKTITIYRAVPKGVDTINKGDWITINKDYAKSHGNSWVDDGKFNVLELEVQVKDIATDGNSIHEFGFDPVSPITKLKSAEPKIVQMPIPNTDRTINAAREELTKPGIIQSSKAIKDLDELVEAISSAPQTYTTLKENRTAFREIVNNLDPTARSQLTSRAKALLKEVESGMTADMKAFAKANLTPQEFNKLNRANLVYASEVQKLTKTRLKNVLDKGDFKPESVKQMLFSQNPSEINLLYKSLAKEGRDNSRAAIISRIVTDLGKRQSGFTPTAFAGELKKYPHQIKTFFKGRDKAQLEGLRRILDTTKRAQEAGVSTPTGQQLIGGLTLGAAATDLGLTVLIGGTVGGAARLYESVPVRNALLKLAGTPKGSTAFEKALADARYALNFAAQTMKSEEEAKE